MNETSLALSSFVVVNSAHGSTGAFWIFVMNERIRRPGVDSVVFPHFMNSLELEIDVELHRVVSSCEAKGRKVL